MANTPQYIREPITSQHLEALIMALPNKGVLYAMRGRVNGCNTAYVCVSWSLANDGNRSGMNWNELSQYGDAVEIADDDDNRASALDYVRSPIQKPRASCFGV